MSSPNQRQFAMRCLDMRHSQRGAASLIVVMILFFIISMVAAYTSRNLLFEQRTSANQYRSTQALEAADAGLQWALGLLNGGRLDGTCVASTDVTKSTFRQRYLNIDGVTGAITPKTIAGGGDLMPSCVFDGGNWQCSCPSNGPPTVTTPSGSGVFPAFRVRFVSVPSRPSVVQIEVNGCTRNVDSCLNFPALGADNEGRVMVTGQVALKGGVTTIPAAALTVGGDLNLGGAALTVANSDMQGTGLTIQSGGSIATGGLVLVTTPGSPGSLSYVANDSSISGLTVNRMFASVFGMWRETYRDQPGAVVMNCGGVCTANAVRTTIAQNPGRVLWLQGDFDVDSAGNIGTVAEPVVIVVTGGVAFGAVGGVINGLLYTQTANWSTSGVARVKGAVVAERNMSGNTTSTFQYDATVLNLLRTQSGSFVLIPGSWKDFQ
jgi:PilX N-terminal